MVGRVDEVDRLGALLREATHPDRVGTSQDLPRVVLVAGDAGIGKTRLVTEVAGAMAAPHVLVARGAAFETDDAVPLGPLSALVRDLLRQLTAPAVAELVGPVRSPLARLLPELGPVAAGDDARPADVLPWLLTRACAGRALVLIVDDAQWADASTLDVLARLVRQVRGPIALVLAHRTGGPVGDRWSRTRIDLARQPGAVEVTLSELAPRECDDLVRAVAGDTLDAATRRSIVERAQGNPLFTEAMAAAAAEGAELPTLLVQALLAPVHRLPPQAQALVRAAAIWGAPARPDALEELADRDQDGTGVDPWRAARDAGVLVDVVDRVDLRHPLLREAVLEDLTVSERTRLREHAVVLLRRRLDDGGSLRTGPVLAGLLEGLGRIPKAVEAYVEAGSLTADVSFSEAAALEAHALELWPAELEEAGGLDRLGLYERAAGHAAAAGDAGVAVRLAREALALWAATDDPDPLTGSRLSWLLAWAGEWELEEKEVSAAYEAAVALAEPLGATPALARALAGLARHRMTLDQNAAGLELAIRAREVTLEAGSAPDANVVLAVMGGALANLGQVEPARAAMEASLAAFDPRRQAAERQRTWLQRGWLDLFAGDGRTAAQTLLDLADEVDRTDVASTWPWLARATAAEMFVWAGQYDRADEEIARVRLALDLGGIDRSLVQSTLVIAECELALRRGRLDEAAAGLEANLALWDDLGLRAFNYHDLVRLAEIRSMQGATAAARALVNEALPGVLAADTAYEVSGLVRTGVLAEGAEARSGARPDLALVRRLLDRLAALDEAGGCEPGGIAAAEALTSRAEAARLLDQDDPRAWESAVTAWDDAGVPWWRAWCQVRLAEALVASRGAREEAAQVLTLAVATGESLGAAPVLDLAVDLARRAGLPVARAVDTVLPPPRVSVEVDLTAAEAGRTAEDEARWDLLTPREREVVELIAGGLSNRAIATALFISEKTVSVHVSNVLAKWGLRSRLEIAAVVHRTQGRAG